LYKTRDIGRAKINFGDDNLILIELFIFGAAKIIFFIEHQNLATLLNQQKRDLSFLMTGIIPYPKMFISFAHAYLFKSKLMNKNLLLLLLVTFLMWNACKKDENSSEPKADFSFLITGNPGEVAFTNKSVNAQTYQWDFGDGKASTMKSPVHVYDFNDTYYVNLIAYGSQKTATFKDTIVITNVVKK